MNSMSRDEQITYIILLIFSAIFLIWIVPSQIMADESASVSPRLLPQILASLIGLISAIQIGRSLIMSSIVRPEFTIERRSYGTMLLVLAVLAGTSLIINAAPTLYVNGIAVGRFWFGIILMVPLFLLICGVRIWWQIILYTVLLIAIVFFLASIAGIYIP